MRSRRPRVVHNGSAALHPNPAAVPREKAVVLGGHLALEQEGLVCEANAREVLGVDVLVEGLLDEVLGLVAGEGEDARVEEDELEVEAGAEHEHVVVHFDLGD